MCCVRYKWSSGKRPTDCAEVALWTSADKPNGMWLAGRLPATSRAFVARTIASPRRPTHPTVANHRARRCLCLLSSPATIHASIYHCSFSLHFVTLATNNSATHSLAVGGLENFRVTAESLCCFCATLLSCLKTPACGASAGRARYEFMASCAERNLANW